MGDRTFEQNASSVQVPPQVCDPQKPQQMADPHSLVDWQGSGSHTLPGLSEMVTQSVPSGQSLGSLSQGISQLQIQVRGPASFNIPTFAIWQD